jgi:hypothetical protein
MFTYTVAGTFTAMIKFPLESVVEHLIAITAPEVENTADISDCGKYRYWLTRCWDRSRPPLMFIMLNPSTADANVDDPTIRRCIHFAAREDCGGIAVVNLFAFRAKSPGDLPKQFDPFGPRNQGYLMQALMRSGPHNMKIVCAWGGMKFAQSYAEDFRLLVERENVPVWCLGTNDDGSPKHPLYLKNEQPILPFWRTS